jgi:hypothetical protein
MVKGKKKNLIEVHTPHQRLSSASERRRQLGCLLWNPKSLYLLFQFFLLRIQERINCREKLHSNEFEAYIDNECSSMS